MTDYPIKPKVWLEPHPTDPEKMKLFIREDVGDEERKTILSYWGIEGKEVSKDDRDSKPKSVSTTTQDRW